MEHSKLRGNEKSYTIHFHVPHYYNRSVECKISSINDRGSIRVAGSYGQGFMEVFNNTLNRSIEHFIAHSEERSYENENRKAS